MQKVIHMLFKSYAHTVMHRVIHMCLNTVFGVVFAQLKTKARLTKGAFGLASRPVYVTMQSNGAGHSDSLYLFLIIPTHSDSVVCGGQAFYDVVTGTEVIIPGEHLKVTTTVIVFEHCDDAICLYLYVSSVCGELYKAFGSVHTDSSVRYCI